MALRVPRPAHIAVLLASSLALALPAQGATPDAGWGVLAHVTWARDYSFVLRDGTSAAGVVLSVSPDSVTLSVRGEPPSTKTSTVTLERSNVLRVDDGVKGADLIYSGRSSWSDVRAIPPYEGVERLEVVTRSGARLTGKTATVSDVEITLAGHRIPKADVSQVYYLRVKPLSDNWEHAFRESLTLYPLSLLFQIHKIAVLLYDSSLPEDNTPLKLEWRTPLPHPPH